MASKILSKWSFMLIATPLLIHLASCKKYLDKKPLLTLATPSHLSDLQALLNNISVINQNSPELLELLSDNYYLTTTSWQSLPGQLAADERLNYIWDKNASFLYAWQLPYQNPIYYANIVLDQLPAIQDKEDQNSFNELKGDALFYRSFAFFQLSQLYCKPFSSSASTDPGIVLKLNSSIGESIARSTVQQTYDQIINDLTTAGNLLPEKTSFPSKPNKAAVYGMLARVYLSMRDYTNAGNYADQCLKKYSTLMDFNTIDNNNAPFHHFNSETIYYSICAANGSALYSSTGKIDTTLYRSYDDNDLRKTLFFRQNTGANTGTYRFKGSYDADYYSQSVFDGINTDEVYLIRAESYARQGNAASAISDLNTLMINRWKNDGSFTPFTATDAADALTRILTERRKELVYRGIRWSDLRRLNLEGAGISLTRIINGVTYSLPPKDPRWVMLIPPVVISRSAIIQNPR